MNSLDGASTINTILSIAGVDLRTLRPMPKVTGGKDNETWKGELKRETDSLTSG